MRNTEIAGRYANAIFEIACENNKQAEFLNGLLSAKVSFSQNKEVSQFIDTPLLLPAEKEKVLNAALKEQNLPEELTNFLLLLARKGRLSLLTEIVISYQQKEDQSNHLTRGVVRAPNPLSKEQKDEILKSIEATTKKKVVLQYLEDKSLIGGVIAQVGSLTFDDSLSAHLNRIKEDLTRRVN